MTTFWKEIDEMVDDGDFMTTITLAYNSVSVMTRYGDDFRYTNLRQIDHKYDIEEEIKNTIEWHKKELKEEH